MIRARRIDVIVVYKVDRLTRSLADFAKLVELFDAHEVSFVSVTQAFNTTTSMGRLTLNMLLSFAQFEREVTGERIRDKIAASKRKGIWMGGRRSPRLSGRKPGARIVVEEHAAFVRDLFRRYLELGSVVRLKAILDHENVRLPLRIDGTGKTIGGGLISRGHLYKILSNPIYLGRLTHKGQAHDGLHDAIVDQETWDRVQRLLAEQAQRTGNSRTRRAPRRQAVRRPRQPDDPEPRCQGRTAMALLCLAGHPAKSQTRGGIRRPRAGDGDRATGRRSCVRGLTRFQSTGSAWTASAEGERPRRVNQFSSGAPARLRSNLTRHHRARRHVSNDDRDRASRDGE